MLHFIEQDYDWLISEINKKDLRRQLFAIHYKIVAYGVSGQLDALEDFCKQYHKILSFYALANRLPLLMLAAYFGYRPLWDFALKKLAIPLTPFEQTYWQSVFDYSVSGNLDQFQYALTNLPEPSNSFEKSLLESKATVPSSNALNVEREAFLAKLIGHSEKRQSFMPWGNRQIPYFSILFFMINLFLYTSACNSKLHWPLKDLEFGAVIYPYSLDVREWGRFISACFLQVTWPHYFLNMVCIVYAAWLERGIGQWRFVSLYLLSGIGAYALFFGMVHFLFPNSPPFIALGASTCLLGVFGAITAYSLETWRDHDVPFAKGLMLFTLIVGITQFISDYFTMPGSMFLHLLGFILGFIIFMLQDLLSKQGRAKLKSRAFHLTIFSTCMVLVCIVGWSKETEFLGSPKRLYGGGELCSRLGKEKCAIGWYLKAAGKGDSEAQAEMGYRYNVGSGVKKDLKLGLYWIEKSALQGNSWGEANLGECYWDGDGTPRNEPKGFYWSEKAANEGIGFAQKRLGDSYLHGWGTSVDLAMAYYWYARALKSADRNRLKVAQIELIMRDLKEKLSPGDLMRMKNQLRTERVVGQ